MKRPTWIDRVLCRLFGKHEWIPAFWWPPTNPPEFAGWSCAWCGKRRDATEVEQ